MNTDNDGKQNRGRKSGVAARIDISEVEISEQIQIINFTRYIQALITTKSKVDAPTFAEKAFEVAQQLKKTPSEIHKAIQQYQKYRQRYPDQPPENAFTSIAPKNYRRPVANTVNTRIQSTKKQPRQGIHISLLPEAQQTEIKAFAERIRACIELQDQFGFIPNGEREKAASELGCTPDWISKSIKIQRAYTVAYPDEPFYNAHTPRQRGRSKGRQVHPEIRESIEDARINRKWLSVNGDGEVDKIEGQITQGLIHSLVTQKFNSPHSKSTTARIIRDFEQSHSLHTAIADTDASALQHYTPAIRNKVSHPGERAQFDARPLPIVVKYKDIVCTVHIMLCIDEASEYIASWDIIPSKNVDDEQQVFNQTFNSQLSRSVVARGVLATGRYQEFYCDHGYESLRPYMHFMLAPDEAPTRLTHSKAGAPRARGLVEWAVKSLDPFLKTRPGFYSEATFRRSRKAAMRKLRTFEDFYTDCAAFIHHWNHDAGKNNTPSRAERLAMQSAFLSVPKPLNLAMFAMANEKETRVLHISGKGWFTLNNIWYEAAYPNAELYEQFSVAARQERKAEIFCFTLGFSAPENIVLFSLDNGIRWHVAAPTGTATLSGRRHAELLSELERKIAQDNRHRSTAFFQKIIMNEGRESWVINGLARDQYFYQHAPHSPPPSVEERLQQIDEMVYAPQIAPENADIQAHSEKAAANPARGKRRKRRETPPEVEAPAKPVDPPAAPVEEPLSPNFLTQLRLKRQQGGN